VDSPSPLEYASDVGADGEVNTNNSYVTLATSSPMRPEEPVVGDAVERGEPTGDRLDEVRTLVPIEEVGEVPDSESDEVPEENEDPLPIREQPPAYSPVRRGQRAMRSGRVAGPHTFHRHHFPYLANQDRESHPAYFQWEISPAKRRRASDDWGREDDRAVKRAQVDDLDVQHEPHLSRPWPSSRSSRGSPDSPDARARASDCK